jgi:hypothetical protein
MQNLKRFKYPFQPCTLQGYVNDDAFFAWKNIELWNGNTWQGTIEEVLYYTFTTTQSLYCCNTFSQSGHHFNAAQRYFAQSRDATLLTISSNEPDERVTASIGQVPYWRSKGIAIIR